MNNIIKENRRKASMDQIDAMIQQFTTFAASDEAFAACIENLERASNCLEFAE